MLEFDIHNGNMTCPRMGLTFSDGPYLYSISGLIDGEPIVESSLSEKSIIQTQDEISVKGNFPKLSIELIQRLSNVNHQLEEIITLRNASGRPITLNQIEFGFVADLNARPDWKLCAVPFRVQLDDSVHDYSTKAIIEGQFRNATYADASRPEPRVHKS